MMPSLNSADHHLVPLDIVGVRPSLIESLPARVVLRPRDPDGGPIVILTLSNASAHSLLHELRGSASARTGSMRLVWDIVRGLRGELTSVSILVADGGLARATLDIEIATGTVHIGLEPGLALAAATVLNVSIVGEERLFDSPSAPQRLSDVMPPGHSLSSTHQHSGANYPAA